MTHTYTQEITKETTEEKSVFITNLIILEVQPLQYYAMEFSSKDKRNMATDTAHVNMHDLIRS